MARRAYGQTVRRVEYVTEFYILKWIETHVEYPYGPLLQYVAKIHIFRPHDVPRVRDLPPGRSADRPERLRGYLYIEHTRPFAFC